ncbi:MAG: hypothetical protein HY081_05050 [Gammaproteobacteria bacterium]|nr:hypothetical protein [Gammaproteobacteria bacterium]
MESWLSVPQLTARRSDEIELHPHKLKIWLEDLPLLNVADTSRKIFSALSAHNRIEFDNAWRWQLLELFRQPIGQIILELTKQYIGLPLPLDEKHKAIAEQNRQFQMELAHGYKRLVLNTAAEAIGGSASQIKRALSIQRAIRHSAEVLKLSFQTYAPFPADTWKEIHKLYLHAEKLGLTKIELDDPANQAGAKSSITQAYQQALLLDFSDPYHLPPRMIDRIHHYLDRWASLALLTEATAKHDPTCQFLIDQDSDRAGIAYTADTVLNEPQRYRLLNTVALSRQVYTQLTLIKGGQMPPADGLQENFFKETGQDILRRMLSAWGVNPQRTFRRSSRADQQVEMAIGLDAINYWINGGRKFMVSSTFVGPMPQRHVVGVPIIKHKDERLAPREFSTWEVEDESAGGLSLSKNGHIGVHVQVGDLLITRTPGEGNPWSIGVIRWVKSPDTSNIEVGIQRLAPTAEPVVVKTVAEDNRESDFLPALLLPEIKPLKQAQTLITHRGMFKPELLIYLDNGYRLYKIAPIKLVDVSNSFEQFRFDILNP